MAGWSHKMGGCFLTKLENKYRKLEGKEVYDESFLQHYVPLVLGRPVKKTTVNAGLFSLISVPLILWLIT